MGPPERPGGIVLSRGLGANVWDADGNRYVDFAAGFGALLVGHSHPAIVAAVRSQSEQLLLALGDVFPADAKVELLERLTALYPGPAQGILAQSGSDAVSAALKTALLVTGRPGVIAFGGAYHGLGYGPMAACGLRESYREPFAAQLGRHVRFVPYPSNSVVLAETLQLVHAELVQGTVGAVLVEPILGRGGVVVPPPEFLPELARLTREHSALLVADEIWTGLGRCGELARSFSSCLPDLICFGKGLGGGLPLSAVIGRRELMQAWQRPAEVVHTATFAGAPLACSAALATLNVIEREQLAERASSLGAQLEQRLATVLAPHGFSVRGAGLMIGIDLGPRPGAAGTLMGALLRRGYLTTTGGGQREVLVLTPPLVIDPALLIDFPIALSSALAEVAS
jgi:4-aminobutyrate aminotransferase / (S)-3-amino-2-methylpropionate transaminase / 5-aminovalerate transaminase